MVSKTADLLKFFKVIATAILLIVSSSCQKEELSRVGFNSEFSSGSSGVTLMAVNGNASNLLLTGNISLDAGEVTVEVKSPDGQVVFQTVFTEPGRCTLDETIPAMKGTWTLRYRSNLGNGHIRLHLLNQITHI
jgi:hypothetical protein